MYLLNKTFSGTTFMGILFLFCPKKPHPEVFYIYLKTPCVDDPLRTSLLFYIPTPARPVASVHVLLTFVVTEG